MTALTAVFALASEIAVAGDCRAPKLTVSISSPSARQGAIVSVTVSGDVALSRMSLSQAGRNVPMEGDPSGRIFRQLLGVDFESAVGPRRISFEAEGLCGDLHRAHRDLRVLSARFPTRRLEVAPAYVEPPESELDRIRREKEEVARVWEAGEAARFWKRAFAPPVEADLRDNFGSRSVFNGKARSPHDGVDIAAAAGAAVTAPAPASVALADNLYFSGGTVILDHGDGLFTTYFHLSRIEVKAGERVLTGRKIGEVGSTGRATGPHLHWGARLHRARVNPLDLLKLPSWPASREEISPTSQSH